MNYGVTFEMYQKIEVNGDNQHPLFKFLISEKASPAGAAIQWNFTKFLLDREGCVVERFEPMTTPEEIDEHIKVLL